MRIQQLDHVALHVADVARSCAFYQSVLRLVEIPRPAFDFPGAWFRLGETQELHLIGGREQPVDARTRGNHFALQVDPISAWEQHLRAGGIDHLPPRRRPDGAVQIFVFDPDGHCIELCCPSQ